MPKSFTVMVAARDLDTGGEELIVNLNFDGRVGEDGGSFKRDLLELVEAHGPDSRKTSSKEVVVLEVESETFARFDENTAGGRRPTNGLYSQRVEVDQKFPSARAASLHLGLKNNEVAVYLSKTNSLPPDERKAKLRGVTLQYVEDYTQALLDSVHDC
jgi:hypothetical protein